MEDLKQAFGMGPYDGRAAGAASITILVVHCRLRPRPSNPCKKWINGPDPAADFGYQTLHLHPRVSPFGVEGKELLIRKAAMR